MHVDTSPAGAASAPGPVPAVELRTPAEAGSLSSVRAVCLDLALREDWDLDAAYDLRLAVDEACSSLVQLATGGTLTCRFAAGDGQMLVTASVRAAVSDGVDEDGFSWQMLRTLTDRQETVVKPDGDAFLVWIELAKRKAG